MLLWLLFAWNHLLLLFHCHFSIIAHFYRTKSHWFTHSATRLHFLFEFANELVDFLSQIFLNSHKIKILTYASSPCPRVDMASCPANNLHNYWAVSSSWKSYQRRWNRNDDCRNFYLRHSSYLERMSMLEQRTPQQRDIKLSTTWTLFLLHISITSSLAKINFLLFLLF